MLNNTETGHPIVLYDGDCGLCNRWVQFVLKRDRRQLFRFASLQSETARELLREHGVSPRMDTVVLLDQGHVYLFSQAILQILRRLGRGWQLLDPGYRLQMDCAKPASFLQGKSVLFDPSP
jgi:predicted DCC family thiol-disulfide oxidoreductase YuxK